MILVSPSSSASPMAASISSPPPLPSTVSFRRTHLAFWLHSRSAHNQHRIFNENPSLALRNSLQPSLLPVVSPFHSPPAQASPDEFLDKVGNFERPPVKIFFWVLVWASLSVAWFAASGDANAAADSIRASGFGLKVASALRGSGWPDEAVVVALATLPVIELRGAIPVGYWMQLKPATLTVLSVLGFVLFSSSLYTSSCKASNNG